MLTSFTLRTHTSRGSLILLNNYYTIPETMNMLILLINFSSPFNSLLKDSVPPLLQPYSQLIILLPDLLRKLKQFPTFRSTLTLLPIFLAVTRWTVLLLKSILHCKLNSIPSCLLDGIISAILISFKNHEFFTTSFPASNQHAAFLRLTNSTKSFLLKPPLSLLPSTAKLQSCILAIPVSSPPILSYIYSSLALT